MLLFLFVTVTVLARACKHHTCIVIVILIHITHVHIPETYSIHTHSAHMTYKVTNIHRHHQIVPFCLMFSMFFWGTMPLDPARGLDLACFPAPWFEYVNASRYFDTYFENLNLVTTTKKYQY